jgi:hypothetical protein
MRTGTSKLEAHTQDWEHILQGREGSLRIKGKEILERWM